MLSQRTPHFYLRLTLLVGELAILQGLLLLFWPFLTEDCPEMSGLKAVFSALLLLCYTCSMLWSGLVVQVFFVRADQILRRIIATNVSFILLSAVVLGILFSRLLDWHYLALLYLSQALCSLLFRWRMRRLIMWVRMRRHRRHYALFVGEVMNVQQLLQLMLNRGTGYSLLGYIANQVSTEDNLVPYHLDTLENLDACLEKHEGAFNELYCTLPSSESRQLRRLADYCDNHGLRFFHIPNRQHFRGYHTRLEMLADVPIFALRPTPLENDDARISKRAFDILFSLLFLLTLFPIVVLIFAPWIKLSSPGPIFFKQKRSGLNGQEFWCYKFRSMRVNAQADQQQATKDDPRKTKVGQFMRRTNIDELPQFINVLLGDMSVVGPRPHMVMHTEQYRELIDKYMVRHMVRPGITGYAQVSGFRGETKELWQMEKRVKHDIFYIEHWSFALDLWIIFRTLINTGERTAY